MLLIWHLARVEGRSWPPEAEERLARAAEFLESGLDQRGRPFLFGDSDRSEVMPLCQEHKNPWTTVLHHYRSLEGRADPLDHPRTCWLVIPEAAGAPTRDLEHSGMESRGYLESGHAYLRSGGLEVHVNGGGLGYGTNAAHGHADAGAIQIRFEGTPVVIDPGTMTYRGGSEWREALVSQAMHATVSLIGTESATRLGPFLWADHYNACLEEFDGGSTPWARIRVPLNKERTVWLTRRVGVTEDGKVEVRDALNRLPEERVRVAWPFAGIIQWDGLLAKGKAGALRTCFRTTLPQTGLRVEKGRLDRPGSPCYSPVFDQLIEGSALIWEGRLTESLEWKTIIEVPI